MENLKVKCDLCDWFRYTDKIKDWHNIYCPACLKSIIITDTDLKIYRQIQTQYTYFLARQFLKTL